MNQRMISLTLAGLLTCAGLVLSTDTVARDGQWRGSSGPSHGQSYDRGHYQGRDHRHRHGRHQQHRYGHQHHRPGRHHYRPPVRAYRPAYVSRYRYHAPTYYRPPPVYRPTRWSRGHYLPHAYYGPTYVIDYRPYRLAPPPYGHHWVRVDGDVLLVALATGLIVEAVHGLFR